MDMHVVDIRGSFTPLFTQTRELSYIPFEKTELDLTFSRKEVLKINRYLDADCNIHQIRGIADDFGRRQEEIFLLMLDRKTCDAISLTEGIPKTYHVLENVDIDWFWEVKDVKKVWEMHLVGLDFWAIGEKINRHVVDVIVLLADLIWNGEEVS